MEKIKWPAFADKSERNDWLVANKSLLIAEKKATVKEADVIPTGAQLTSYFDGSGAEKSIANTTDKLVNSTILSDDVSKIRAKLAINTTNVMDSHMDVHIPGLWKKSISEQSTFYLTQEHALRFDKIISEDVKCFTRKMSWAQLNAPFEGSTEVLMFDALIDDRNEYMKGQYAKGYVKNHSVGMRYVKMYMCMNDERYPEYKAMWDKYYPEVHNKDTADAAGVFWAVTEAQVVEGSAVVKGSNIWTPTISMRAEGSNDNGSKSEPSDDTQIKIEPESTDHADGSAERPNGTQKTAVEGNDTVKNLLNINLY